MDKTQFYRILGFNKNSKLETAITCSLLVFITGSLFVNWYSDSIDFLHLSETESLIHYVGSLIRDIGFSLAVALVVISRLINYSKESKKWLAKLKVLGAIFAMVAWSLGSLYYHYELIKINETSIKLTERNPKLFEDVKEFIRTTDMDKAELAKFSTDIAKKVYVETGQIEKVYSIKHGFVDFKPSETDVKHRLETAQADRLMRHMEESFYSGSIATLIILLLSLIVGFSYNRYKLKRWL